MTNYTSSWIVDFFHSWPHLTFKFTLVSEEDYKFDNNAYYESLAMIALMAVVWLVLTMTVFAIHFCCSKSKGKSESGYSPNGCYCSICVFVIFLMLSLGCIGVAVYGNMQAADGIKAATIAVRTGNDTFYGLNTKVFSLKSTNFDMMKSVNELKTLMPDVKPVYSVEGDLYKIVDALNKVNAPLSSVEDRLGWSVNVLVVTEDYRKITTISLLGFQCFLCFLGLLGVCCRSKWMLIMMIALGMIGITATSFYLGADLMFSVAASDFCFNPYFAVYNQTVDKQYLSVEEADYFLTCSNPDAVLYSEEFKDGHEIMQNAIKFIDWALENNDTAEEETEVLYTLRTDVQKFSSQLDSLESSLECESTSVALKNFINSTCGITVEGFFALSIAIFSIILCMSFVVCAAVVTAKRYGKPIRRSSSADDLNYSDPFLPRSAPYNGSNRPSHVTRTNNPIYATTVSSNSNYGVATTNTLSFFRPGSDENVSLLDTPPPYSPPRSSSRPSH